MNPRRPDGALFAYDLELGTMVTTWRTSDLLDQASLPLDETAKRCLDELDPGPPDWATDTATPTGVLATLSGASEVDVLLEELRDGRHRLEALIRGDYEAWAYAAILLIRLAGATAAVGARGRLATTGIGTAAHDGAGFLGIEATPGGIATHFEPELQDLTAETIHRFVPADLELFTRP